MVTCVFFHAHPDDEALLTAGTMARLSSEGHRVVLVVATAGEAGLVADGGNPGVLRRAELRSSAALLGCDRLVELGYPDSGLSGSPTGFSAHDPHEVARRLADVLHEEEARMLTSYDPNGGYGHPDHRQVHRVATLAAKLARTPILLEATVDRTWYARGLKAARVAGVKVPPDTGQVYSSSSEITHRVDVRPWLAEKRASMAAHASQASSRGGDTRTLAVLLRLPRPLFRLALGTEWYVRREMLAGSRMTHPLAELC
ncbi:PIG-L deacetylase family protein [Lentzea jiangxiensis]|uniref:N-acetylglucosaminyl deacetylase, LmbE family n=1 Tax=Lentzea jiangxiensis TaxID=641025 RepID=A0A1H0X3N2_9PSEU|nr:PIG-L family deacetylase [Lentzea jiangxiensis]SDP97522.1 N-acetylglucosaminyl deacetylase, LmbE family [Lentzea jiangxiensis]